jgi:hypothetical protein
MVIGTTIFKGDGSPYFSPSFPRGGLAGAFSLQARNIFGTPSMTATLQHRNADETSFADVASFDPVTAIGSVALNAGNLKEILRFKYAFDAGDASTDGVHFVMQTPSWRPYV